MTSTSAAVAHTNYTAITITLGIIFIIGAVIVVVVASYYRLQRHRADAVAMASYRKLPEDAVANQQEMRGQLEKLITSADARSAGRRSGP